MPSGAQRMELMVHGSYRNLDWRASEGKSLMLKFSSSLLWLSIMVCYSMLLTFSLCLPFFLPRRHREMADDIEAIAARAVRASKQTFSFLMDLLEDNSTEEYISNLTEQWAQKNEPKHTPTQTLALAERMSPIHIKQTVLQNPNKLLDSLDYCAFCSIFHTKCTYPCITAQVSLLYSGPLKHVGV